MMLPRDHRSRPGFSLLELLAVVTILSVISAVVIPRIGYHTRTAKREACQQYRADINSMSERYYFDHGEVPALDDLKGEPYFFEPIPVCPLTGEAYTLNSQTGRVVGHEH